MLRHEVLSKYSPSTLIFSGQSIIWAMLLRLAVKKQSMRPEHIFTVCWQKTMHAYGKLCLRMHGEETLAQRLMCLLRLLTRLERLLGFKYMQY